MVGRALVRLGCGLVAGALPAALRDAAGRRAVVTPARRTGSGACRGKQMSHSPSSKPWMHSAKGSSYRCRKIPGYASSPGGGRGVIASDGSGSRFLVRVETLPRRDPELALVDVLLLQQRGERLRL